MAEEKEAGGKAADIYVGVVDLFSIILPGALLALVSSVQRRRQSIDLGRVLPDPLKRGRSCKAR
jgi:hypothetical protein